MPLYDDSRKYSVKETAQILGINSQSLRYYDRVGLIEPFYRDPDNQYRYYTINQFYQIEMFKLAKSLGLPLSDYRTIYFTDDQIGRKDFSDLEQTLNDLERTTVIAREELDRRLLEIARMRKNISVLQKGAINGRPYYDTLPDRCIYVVDHDPNVPFEETSIRMRRGRRKYQDYLTEYYGFLLDTDAAQHGDLVIRKQFVELDTMLEESDEILHLPRGTYANFLYHGFCPEEPTDSLSAYLTQRPVSAPYLVADEIGYYDQVPSIIHAVRVPVLEKEK
ncbi:MerR family transcriptional regulator [Adlercreutzia sp. R25]|uniref:MerR family transcriptional regulator n=1 Tax=Adlercreutzia shanghongiae TaxID=3111773 RepID=A0ABU6IZ30_9ACTN|nr:MULTISPECIES: MerR family transcriptional regulator [unclassified Adlercreutzia]MEC4272781.1 MerR family transcriptional regulator [Adlercreutzia sp. R25]MEC4295101.1 MerR family transcriptional regulator [Adlercreutzia sp. R22]